MRFYLSMPFGVCFGSIGIQQGVPLVTSNFGWSDKSNWTFSLPKGMKNYISGQKYQSKTSNEGKCKRRNL